MSIKIFHNPRCKHSRAGLEYLKGKTTDIEIRSYLTEPPTAEELKDVLLKLNKKPSEILRTQEEYFKLELKGKSFTNEEWIKILCENPKLIQRPIVIGKHKAVVANPPEEINKII
ncbi:MAG: arsenate reductase family protein [Bacteroidales bacterium]|nr:arsenate reductase family protein [Bacteroidales bacterium]MBN2750778.1 arsenate reductase family protein [Bacteroidales bacterium]